MKIFRESKLRLGYQQQAMLHDLEQRFERGGAMAQEARGRFVEEWAGVLDTLTWCMEHAESDTSAAILLSKLCGVSG
ncbi:MAG: hypothetical protein AAF492_22910, partial [Verrucomicrobiota bacterium]